MRLVLDLETTSTADLRKTGTHAYAEHPDTRVTVACFAIDDGPVVTWTGGPVPASFIAAVRAGAVVVAHNYLFELNLYAHKLVPLGWPPIPLLQWSCTMARALVAGWPASLELIGRAARLNLQKDAGARGLMLRMARPRTLIPEITWWHETSPEHFARLCEYCAQDVEVERAVDRLVPELSPRERAVFWVDYAINQRGLNVDLDLVDRLIQLAERARDALTGMIQRLTQRQVMSLNQVAALRAWLATQGVQVPDLRRGTVRGLLGQGGLPGPARQALQGRLDISRSSTAKLAAILPARSRDGRVRGTFQFYGASRTGRWAGRRLQPQNLFRGSISDVPRALRAIEVGADPDDLEMLFEDSCMGVVASCLRSTIWAAPYHRLVVMDLSQIEARVLAWLAGQQDALAVFRRGDDIYTATARAIGSSSRQLGKVLVLACGFGMGVIRFIETALTFGLRLGFGEAHDAVMAWRSLNQRIVQFWWDCHHAIIRVMRAGPGATERVGQITFIHRRKALLIRLPSGRHLVYRSPAVTSNGYGYPEFTYWGSLGGNWVWLRSWPGKIVENITQAVARDVLVESMLTLHQDKVPLIATVHDELIAEVPTQIAEPTYQAMLRTMRRSPSWAPGLPCDAAGFVTRRYQKG